MIDANAISKRQNVIPNTRLIDHAVLIGVLGYKFRGNAPTWVEEQGKIGTRICYAPLFLE